jgi:hypothetical protein
MRRVLILAAIISLTACAAPPPQLFWEKEGVGPETTDLDLTECRRTARQEALNETSSFGFGGFSRFGPYYGYRHFYGHSRRHHPPIFRRGPFVRRGVFFWGGPFYGGPYYGGPSEFDREVRLTAFCMRVKGYELVTVPPAPTVAPGVVPRPPPAATAPPAPKDN